MSQEQAVGMFDPMARSPLEFMFGVYIADTPAYGGAHGFAWFEDEAGARDYLRNQLWRLYDPEADELASEHKGLRGAIAMVLQETPLGEGIPCQRINDAQSVFELRWAGDFFDLWIGNGAFEEQIQYDYRENVFGDERGFGEGECADQADHLLHYCG